MHRVVHSQIRLRISIPVSSATLLSAVLPGFGRITPSHHRANTSAVSGGGAERSAVSAADEQQNTASCARDSAWPGTSGERDCRGRGPELGELQGKSVASGEIPRGELRSAAGSTPQLSSGRADFRAERCGCCRRRRDKNAIDVSEAAAGGPGLGSFLCRAAAGGCRAGGGELGGWCAPKDPLPPPE